MHAQKSQKHSRNLIRDGNLSHFKKNACCLFAEIHFMMPESESNFIAIKSSHTLIRCAAPVCIMLILKYLSPLVAIKAGTE